VSAACSPPPAKSSCRTRRRTDRCANAPHSFAPTSLWSGVECGVH
jgi:hypothetical protein